MGRVSSKQVTSIGWGRRTAWGFVRTLHVLLDIVYTYQKNRCFAESLILSHSQFYALRTAAATAPLTPL